MTVVEKKFQLGPHEVTLQTGLMARQANASVVVRMNNTVVLATVVAQDAVQRKDFFPLTVNYQEKAYAYGRVPTGFKRREGPPSEREILISRLIDRPIRPLFPDWYVNEVQIVATLLSVDPEAEPDVAALIAAAAAVRLAGLPAVGPVAGVRVGYSNGELLLNPKIDQSGDLDLFVAGTESSILMVEAAAQQVSQELMLDALVFAQKHIAQIVNEIESFAVLAQVAPPVFDAPTGLPVLEGWKEFSEQYAVAFWAGILASSDKKTRSSFMKKFEKEMKAAYVALYPELNADALFELNVASANWQKQVVRQNMLASKVRVDKRATDAVRPINCLVDLLPAPHGSALFTRGETQSLTAITLGSGRDVQTVETHDPREMKEWFMLHYNFPPFSVGEVGQIGSPKRREVGHGRLARRAFDAVLPTPAQFPYAIRAVSEVLESNGSSSMATVCATTLGLMAAGVPISAPVAGIAMGLICEGDDFMVLTDILGDEDHLGDMDFKVAGTERGITALQMDIKVEGVSLELMKQALAQAHTGRLHILGIMNECLSQPRPDIAPHAPRIETIKIRPEQVREVIGKGGSVVKMITELSGATLELSDDGTVNIVSLAKTQSQKAKELIKQITDPLTLNKSYVGQVVKIMDFGFVISILGGKEGLVHISECPFHPDDLPFEIKMGQRIEARLIHIDKLNHRYRFTLLDESARAQDEMEP